MVSGAIHFRGRRACSSDEYVNFGLRESTSQNIIVSVVDTHISLADIVWVFVDISSEAKVTDLYYIVLWEQNVSGC